MKSFILFIFVLFITSLQAKEYKVIYDCSSSNGYAIMTFK